MQICTQIISNNSYLRGATDSQNIWYLENIAEKYLLENEIEKSKEWYQ